MDKQTDKLRHHRGYGTDNNKDSEQATAVRDDLQRSRRGAVVSSLVCLREAHNHTPFYSSLPLSRPRLIMSLSSTLYGQPFGILLSLYTIYPVATLGPL